MRSFRSVVLGLAGALACASACSDDDDGGSGDKGSSGSAGSAGAGKAGTAGTAGTAGSANGGTAGTSTGGNAGSVGGGTAGANTGGMGMGGEDGGEAGMSGEGTGGAGMGGAGMAGAGGAGMGGAGMAGAGGAGNGGAAGAGAGGMAGAGMSGAGGAGAGGMAGAGTGGGGGAGGGTPAPINLFFSEYYEGTSATQTSAVEIYNAGTESVNLTGCALRIYVNGAVSFSTILLITTLLPNQVHVVCSTAIGANCDQTSDTMAQVTGNDAISLVCNGTEVQDIIGQIGNNPANGEWGTGNASTANNTIRRMCSVTTGDRLGIDAFNPAFQWTGFPANTSGDLGIRFCP